MKKLFIMLTLVAMVFAIGCHKENNSGNSGGGGEEPAPTVVTYTVTFNANGGTGTMQPQTFTKGETKALTANVFTYQYHTFVNWNTMADGSGTSYTDGQEITVVANMTLYAQWSNMVNGHEWVDLGLPSGTLWATTNVGANTPTDYGDYFAWGETEPKATYNWSTYKYANGDYNKLTKYCNTSSFGDNGFTDTLTVLLPEDDAATANWGNGWRMPTKAEMQELKENCTITWTTQNGVNGCLFTGSNGNSLFLPAASGRWNGDLYNIGTVGEYWLSTLYMDGPTNAWYLAFGSSICAIGWDSIGRFLGYTVRPVCSVSQK